MISLTGRMWASSSHADQPDTVEVTDGTRLGIRDEWSGEIRWEDGEVTPPVPRAPISEGETVAWPDEEPF